MDLNYLNATATETLGCSVAKFRIYLKVYTTEYVHTYVICAQWAQRQHKHQKHESHTHTLAYIMQNELWDTNIQYDIVFVVCLWEPSADSLCLSDYFVCCFSWVEFAAYFLLLLLCLCGLKEREYYVIVCVCVFAMR